MAVNLEAVERFMRALNRFVTAKPAPAEPRVKKEASSRRTKLQIKRRRRNKIARISRRRNRGL